MKIAVVGGGIAGLTAAYYLDRSHDVRLFEKSGRLGGNAYTYQTRKGEPLDIAVAAFGKAGYPDFYALLKELGIGTRACANSYMSFHDLDGGDGLYITPDPAALRQQGFRLLDPRRLRSFARLFLGLRKANRLHDEEKSTGLTLREVIDIIPEFHDRDSRLILLCALCLLSSMSAEEVLRSPADFFIEKLKTHNDVLSPRAVFSVRCVEGGTRSYVDAIAQRSKAQVHLNSSIRKVARTGNDVVLHFEDGHTDRFDRVVFACSPDRALALLEAPTESERNLLGAWRYKDGRVVLHRDRSSFPSRSLTQAYTFLYTHRDGVLETSVNGALWHEPQADPACEYISSQHPNFPIRDELIEFEAVLRTPVYDFRSYPTIRKLPELNGVSGTYYCGSYFGFGLHEDAVRSAKAVAREINRTCSPLRSLVSA